MEKYVYHLSECTGRRPAQNSSVRNLTPPFRVCRVSKFGTFRCKICTHTHWKVVAISSPKTPDLITTDTSAIQAILARRRRLLTELFFLSKYANIPQEYQDDEGAAGAVVDSEDLTVFLAENDLENERQFDERTLPQTQLEAVDSSTQQLLEKNLITDADHAIEASHQEPPHSVPMENVQITASNGVLVDDVSLQDAEIAKASLLDLNESNNDLLNEAEKPLLMPSGSSASKENRVRYAMVEDRRSPRSSDFDVSAWLIAAQSKPLLEFVQGAKKTMGTSDWSAALTEQKWIKISERIQALKTRDRWSLEQIVRQKSAPRQKAHWDYMLDEMKWMRTDFREERKWKTALAFKVAHAVREWHDAVDRDLLVIHPRPNVYFCDSEDVEMKDSPPGYEPPTPPSGSEEPVPNSVPSNASELQRLYKPADVVMIHSPPLSATDDDMHIFEMPVNEIYAYNSDHMMGSGMNDVSTFPVYGPPLPDADLYSDPLDSVPLISMSKFTQNEINILPPRKRGRSEHEDADATIKVDSDHPTSSTNSKRKTPQLTFAIRPPFVPSNIDHRAAHRKDNQIVWTPELDELLLNLLVDYQYNWDFVAQAMTPSTLTCAVADRRSAWDCFERWVQIDPKSNGVIFTGAHARLVQSKVDDMIRIPKTMEKNLNRRQATPLSQRLQRADLKKQRQFSMFDAMRKVQRKRENQPKTAPPKKIAVDVSKTPPVVPTPRHLSQMKAERDEQSYRSAAEQKIQQQLMQKQQRHMQQQQLQQQQKGGPPTQAQIAQIHAARQTQHRAQLAQHAAQQVANGAATAGIGAQLPDRGPVNPHRPSLVGQMPPRPGSSNGVTLPSGVVTNGQIPNPALLRIPPGQRLSQEQMNQLLQQARLQKSMVASPAAAPPAGAAGQPQPHKHPQSNGHLYSAAQVQTPSPAQMHAQAHVKPKIQAPFQQAQAALQNQPSAQSSPQIRPPSQPSPSISAATQAQPPAPNKAGLPSQSLPHVPSSQIPNNTKPVSTPSTMQGAPAVTQPPVGPPPST